MPGPLDFANAEVRTKEITRLSRLVVRLEGRCSKLNKRLDAAHDELIQARRFLRGVIADTVEQSAPHLHRQEGDPV